MEEIAESQATAKLLEDEVPWAGKPPPPVGPGVVRPMARTLTKNGRASGGTQDRIKAHNDRKEPMRHEIQLALDVLFGVQTLQSVLHHHVPQCPLPGGVPHPPTTPEDGPSDPKLRQQWAAGKRQLRTDRAMLKKQGKLGGREDIITPRQAPRKFSIGS